MTHHHRTAEALTLVLVALVLLLHVANLTADAIGAGIGNANTTMEGE